MTPEPPYVAELANWLPANDEFVRPLVALSTFSADGYPDTRHVLLSEYDDAGFYFHTDSRSRKVAQTDALPRASFAIAWPELGRQLVVVGDVERASEPEAERVYARRSPYLQTLAWLNTPEFAEQAPDARLTQWAAFTSSHPSGTLTPPSTWLGLLLRPRRVTLWHGSPDTASRRIEYSLAPDGSWATSLLPG